MDTTAAQSRPSVVVFVFSHNDEGTIAGAVESLVAALRRSPTLRDDALLYVLPNGCRDRTAERAQEALSTLAMGARATVESIERGGKANAWNHAVHEILPRHPEADVAIFLDSDIDLSETDLDDLVALLREQPNVLATISHPRKRRVPFSFGRFAAFLSSRSVTAHKNGVVCGQLYAIRADWAQRIWMPRGLLVEDGFVAGCLRTRFFSAEPDDSLIIAHPRTYHYFEVEPSFVGAIKHEERTELGSHMNFVAYPLLWQTENAESYLAERYAEDPDWLVRLFEEQLAARGRGLFRWQRCIAAFRELRFDRRLPVRFVMAFLRTFQRTVALERAYRRASRGDLRW